MFELERKEYNKILPLLKDITHSRGIVYSVVEGNTEGKIFVDDYNNPKTAFIEWEFSYLVGFDGNENFNNNIYSYIFNDMLPKSKEKELILFTLSAGWEGIKKLFKEKGCIEIQRKMFNFSYNKYKENKLEKTNITDEFSVVKIEEEFVNKYQKHKDILKSPSRFGFSIVNEFEIISECTCVAIGAKEAEISIETNEKYQNKGYATRVCNTFIDYCISNKIVPNWSCWPFRKESINLAHKLGFQDKEDVPAIYWSENM